MRILVVEDEKKLAGFIKRALVEDSHAVDVAVDGEEGSYLAGSQAYDLVILDILLPKKDGLAILRELREARKTTPVLILSARGQVKDRVKGLDLGADDYLAKPFSLDELRARIRALLRRGSEAGSSTLKLADLTMDLLRREVRRGGDEVRLTPREYALLEYLMRHAGHPVTREQISDQVWKQPFDPSTNIVDVYINYLRRKLESQGGPQLVHTVRGVGYVLKEA